MSEFNTTELGNLSNNYKSNVLFIIEKIETEMYWCKNYILPGIQMTVNETDHTPYTMKHPSDKFTFEDLSLDFYVDEELNNYETIYNWLMKFKLGTYTDDDIVSAQLLLFDTSLTEVKKRAVFYNLFPFGINSLEFNNQRTDEENIMNISFAYDIWKLKS